MAQQGDVYFAQLHPTIGHEQSGHRPVLIMQNNILNKNLSTLIIAPISTNLKAKGKMTTHFLPKGAGGLERDSVALIQQLRTINKKRLEKRLGTVSKEEMTYIKGRLFFVF